MVDCPAGQVVHNAWPAEEKRPMSQALHWALPLTAACCPLGHAVQFAAATALSVDCPAGHAAQYDTPLGEKRPLPHVAHVYEMAMHPWPAGQSHGRHCMAPAEEY